MAKKSVIAREARKIATVKRFAHKVNELKAMIHKAKGEEKIEVLSALSQMPRDSSSSRLHRRCQICGRPRGVYRRFGLCRICLRKAAMRGDVPGLIKASW